MVRTSRRPWVPVSKETASHADGHARPPAPLSRHAPGICLWGPWGEMFKPSLSFIPVKVVFQWETNPIETPRRNTSRFSGKLTTSPSFCPFLTDGKRGAHHPWGHWPQGWAPASCSGPRGQTWREGHGTSWPACLPWKHSRIHIYYFLEGVFHGAGQSGTGQASRMGLGAWEVSGLWKINLEQRK